MITSITVPLACAGALLFIWLFGQSLKYLHTNWFDYIIGLISKHGILLIEFANQLRQEGKSAKAAIQQACAMRLRPILMTTAAMIFGALPLIISHDAGNETRRALVWVLLGGLSVGTLFTLYLLPGVYLWVVG